VICAETNGYPIFSLKSLDSEFEGPVSTLLISPAALGGAASSVVAGYCAAEVAKLGTAEENGWRHRDASSEFVRVGAPPQRYGYTRKSRRDWATKPYISETWAVRIRNVHLILHICCAGIASAGADASGAKKPGEWRFVSGNDRSELFSSLSTIESPFTYRGKARFTDRHVR
jgi:hypothetical protein